jgi:TM2 domain-containing membrane protein YozV
LADADEGIAQAAFASCKGEILMMVMAGFFGCYGVDRFMLGEVGLGVAKLLTCGGCGIWAMMDSFTAPARTRKYNSEKILSQL